MRTASPFGEKSHNRFRIYAHGGFPYPDGSLFVCWEVSAEVSTVAVKQNPSGRQQAWQAMQHLFTGYRQPIWRRIHES